MKVGGLMTIELGILIGLVGTIAGMFFGYKGHQRSVKNDLKSEVKEDTKDHTELKTNIEYIRRGVDDIRIDLKAQETRVTELAGEVIRVGEIAKSAHKRIDTIEERRG